MTTTENRTHTIDATGKRLGIVATEAARVLLGKDKADFVRHLTAPVTVTITNAGKLDVPNVLRLPKWASCRNIESPWQAPWLC
jgi:ribosomal protein L13